MGEGLHKNVTGLASESIAMRLDACVKPELNDGGGASRRGAISFR